MTVPNGAAGITRTDFDVAKGPAVGGLAQRTQPAAENFLKAKVQSSASWGASTPIFQAVVNAMIAGVLHLLADLLDMIPIVGDSLESLVDGIADGLNTTYSTANTAQSTATTANTTANAATATANAALAAITSLSALSKAFQGGVDSTFDRIMLPASGSLTTSSDTYNPSITGSTAQTTAGGTLHLHAKGTLDVSSYTHNHTF